MMRFGATIDNRANQNEATLRAGDHESSISITPKTGGFGSSASGAELLFLALATCNCNEIYREAAKLEIDIERVQVDVDGELESERAPAKDVRYRARLTSSAADDELHELMIATDKVAEIQNTLRAITPVEFELIGGSISGP